MTEIVDAVRIEVSREERERGACFPERLAAARRAIIDDGFVVLDDVVPVDQIDALRERMHEDLPELQRRNAENPRRWAGHLQHQPPADPAYLFPDLIANPYAISVARVVLGHDIRIVLYTANTNLPDSVRQGVHPDINQLWPDEIAPSPAHLLVCNVALVDTTAACAVELWPGTHTDPRTYTQAEYQLGQIPTEWLEQRRTQRPPIQVAQRKGSILLRDARLWHAGVPNTSGAVRVMVAMGYAPAWYAATPLTFPSAAEPVLSQLSVPVLAQYTDEPFDHLDPRFSGLSGPQMQRRGQVARSEGMGQK